LTDQVISRQVAPVIRKLRVQGTGLDPLLTKLRVDYLLDTLDLSVSHLSPAAVLCIRSLRDPRPRTVQLYQAVVDPAWQRAVRDQIDRLARGARRRGRAGRTLC
jgi:hypothetical protein